MTRRQAVLDALKHIEHRIVPYNVNFTGRALEQLVACTGDHNIEKTIGGYLSHQLYLGWPTALADRPGFYRDAFGVVWNRTGADDAAGVVDSPLITDVEAHDYVFPAFDEARLRAEYRELVGRAGDRFSFAGFGLCMFERSCSLMGMEQVLMSMVAAPEALHRLYDAICEYTLAMLDIALEYDIDGIYFEDDWGQQRGLLMGPAHWRSFIKPRMARLYARVKSRGKYVLQHACGDCHEVFSDLIEMGLDCYHTFQSEIYDMSAIKREYGRHLAFWGGISVPRCLQHGTPGEVRRETARVMDALRGGGGYIAAPSHTITFGVPPENIMAMVEVFQNQARRYGV